MKKPRKTQAEKYEEAVEILTLKLQSADVLTSDLERQVQLLSDILKRSKYDDRWNARKTIWSELSELKKRAKYGHLKLIQGRNEFISRKSQVKLTLIVSPDTMNKARSA
jgi:hypothetical protein